jgi:PhnB protein
MKRKTPAKKTKAVKPIPDGYPVLTPYLIAKDAAKAIEFYIKAFGGKERMRMPGPNGAIGHAEIAFGSSLLMIADEFAPMGAFAPQAGAPTPVFLTLYVKDIDAVFQRAVDMGATVKQPLEDKFYGDRSGALVDPFGHCWCLMMHVEDVSPAELKKRAAALSEKRA